MPRPCIEPGCNQLAHNGARCEPHRRGQQHTRNTRRRNGRTWAAAKARQQLNRNTWGTCAHCHQQHPAQNLEVDHTTPLADGGTDTPDNLQILCRTCHQTKTTTEHRARTTRRQQT